MIRALLIAALLAGCGSASPTPVGRTIVGTVTLHAEEGTVFGDACRGDGGYSDIAGGMGVTLRDQEGTVLGASRLSTGEAGEGRRSCVFDFSFPDAPRADFYSIAAGRRGELTYSYQEMEENGWSIALEIGD